MEVWWWSVMAEDRDSGTIKIGVLFFQACR
jgi:hypothetical protein